MEKARLESKRFGFNSFQLKCIAIITMAIDHTGAVLFPEYPLLRIIGRLAFPIFCFLIVEGFLHTRNVMRYAVRLGIFALISEIPFDMTFFGTIYYPNHQNVFFTLWIGLMVLYVATKIKHTPLQYLVCAAGMFLALILQTDYSYVGVLMIFLFYILRNNVLLNTLAQFGLNAFVMGGPQSFGTAAMLPIWLYNGKKGPGYLKYLFYVFYPLHMIILWSIKNQ